jgi:hypothetical protein
MKNLSRGKKILIGFGVIFIILLLIISFGANIFISNLLQNKIESKINENPEIPYNVVVGDINVGIFSGSLKLRNITITPKQSITDSLSSETAKSLLKGNIKVIKIHEARYIKFLTGKELIIRKITIRGAELTALINKNVKKTESKKPDSTGVRKSPFSDKFNELKIRKFELKDINYTELDFNNQKDTLLYFRSLSVNIEDILFNEQTYNKPIPIVFDELTVNVEHLSEKSMKFYELSTTGIDLNMTDTIIVVKNFNFLPKYSRKEHNRRLKYENDLFSLKTKSVTFNGLDFKELLSLKSGVKLNSIVVQSPDIQIYRDKNLPDPPYKYHPLLASLIKKIPVPFIADSVLIKDGNLVYAEKQKHTETPGEVSFTNMNITFGNVTNNPDRLVKNHFMPIDIEAKLYGKGILKVRLDLDLTSNNESFNVRGSLGPIKASASNKMTKELLLVEITSGDIKGVLFNFSADDDVSNGEIIVNYQNLKVNLIKGKDTTKKAKFMSFVAGGALNKNNMPGDKKYRTGIINFERVKGKGLPNYLWKSILSGLISTIAPIGENKNQREKSKAIKKEQKSRNKDNKKNRKKKKRGKG